jgi:hypothetical protein
LPNIDSLATRAAATLARGQGGDQVGVVTGHDLDRVGAGIKRKAARQTERRCRSGNWHIDPSDDPVDPPLVPANSFAEYAPEPNPERQAATRAKAERSGADKICRLLKASPSMWAFIVAIIVFGLTLVISILVLFRYGMSDNQSLAPSTAAETTFTVGTLIAFAIAASHWLPQLGW